MRQKLLEEIDGLLVNNCYTCDKFNSVEAQKSYTTFCKTKCKTGKTLVDLGYELSEEKNERINKILAKGQDMTTNEIKYLVEIGITKAEISRSLGLKRGKGTILVNQIIGLNKNEEDVS